MGNVRTPVATLFTALILLVVSRPAQATFPDENGKIVFVGNQSGSWQLYTINPDGSDTRQVTFMPPTDSGLWLPAFSPDGRKIAFCYGTDTFGLDAKAEIYVVNADGIDLKQVTDDGAFDGFPRWSPDGKTIVFAGTARTGGVTTIKRMRSVGAGAKRTLASDFWFSLSATYTPDGKKLVFDSQLDGLVSAVWIMNADGSDKDRLTPASLEGGPSDVSPDGRRIVLVDHENTGAPSSIYSMRIEGGDLRQLTRPGNASDSQPGYSPDGKKIVFISNRMSSNNSQDIFTMNVDGSKLIRIANGRTVGGCPNGSSNCVDPSWGPKTKD